MQRRKLTMSLALAPLSCVVSGLAFSQTENTSKQDSVQRPFRKVSVPEDGRLVIFFFDFACPFCAAYHGPLHNFSGTVPKQVQTMFIPVVNMADVARRQEQMIAAQCFYSALQVANKSQMALFAGSVYESYSIVRNLSAKAIWIKAVKVAGIDLKKFTAALQAGKNDSQIQFAARKNIQYALTVTPSVAVGGKYVITPEDVMGDQEKFFQLLNGLTSEIL